jgi:hypothetical protein
MAELTDIGEAVREKYAAAAKAVATETGCCGSAGVSCSPADEEGLFGSSMSTPARRSSAHASRSTWAQESWSATRILPDGKPSSRWADS